MKTAGKIGIGLVGLGSIGAVHSEVLTSEPISDSFALVAVCDKQQKDSALPFYTDYSKFLAHPGLQAVAVATPEHFELARDAVKAGKHVLIEKPPTLNILELKELEQLGKTAGVSVFTAFHAACRPEVAAAKRILEHKAVQSINITYREDVLHYCDPNGWIFDPTIAGGGVFMSSGINAISIVYAVLPDIDLRVSGVDLHTPSGFRVESSGTARFSFDGGHGKLDMDWFHKGAETRCIEFKTTDGVYVIDIVRGTLSLDGKVLFGDTNGNAHLVDQSIEYRGVYQEFSRLISERASYVSYRELACMLDVYKKR